MPFDKVIDSALLDAGMSATANAIRQKTGGTSPISWDPADGFKAAVEEIDIENGVELPELDAPASEADVFLGKEYIDGNGQKQSGSFTIDEELTEQDVLISQIAEALRNKTANGSGVVLPELTDPGTAADLALDKQLLDPDGQIVTGTLAQIASGYAISAKDNPTVAGSASTGIRIKAQSNSGDYILRSGAYLVAAAPAESFGDAAASHVLKGKTFTSAAGLLVEGTHECEGGVTLPVLTNPATATDLARDKQLLDPDGQIVTGTLAQIASGYAISAKDNPTVAGSASTGIRIKAQSNSGDYILRSGAYLIASAPAESFGDAAASHVLKGKTFTSAAGLLVEGTMEASGGQTGFIRMLERTSGDLTVPEGCTAIGDYAFYYNSALTGLTLPDTVTKIGYRSFYQCTALAQLQLPAGLDTIDSQAFYNCRELTGLTFRSTPSSIANNAFGACSNLTVINVPWASGAVANAPWGATNANIVYNYTGEDA